MRSLIAIAYTVTYTLAGCLSLASLALADTPSASQPSAGQKIKSGLVKLTLTNESFVEKAALAGETEVALSKLAIDRSSDANVQAFAKRMVKDHTAASEQLQSIAQSKNIAVPKGLDEDHQATVIKVGKYNGADFDKEYNEQMRKDHDMVVTLFSAAAGDDKLDPALREFANKTLPVLREHQHDAHSLKTGKPVSSSQ